MHLTIPYQIYRRINARTSLQVEKLHLWCWFQLLILETPETIILERQLTFLFL